MRIRFIHHTRGESLPGPCSSWRRCLPSANSISPAQLPFQRLKKSYLQLTESFFQESSHLTLSWLIACKEGVFQRPWKDLFFPPHEGDTQGETLYQAPLLRCSHLVRHERQDKSVAETPNGL